MQDHLDTFWQLRLERCQKELEKNNFRTFIATSPGEARNIFFDRILPHLEIKTISWGDSLTFRSTKILDELREKSEFEIIETFEPDTERAVLIERRRQALLVDLFFTGSNAVTEDGRLVNLDMVGNRVAALTFGPRHLVLCIGRNKIVPDLESAMSRIKSYAAPINAIRHTTFKTPCMKTSYCHDCRSPDRICNTWTITEKAFPAGRINVILINEDLGF